MTDQQSTPQKRRSFCRDKDDAITGVASTDTGRAVAAEHLEWDDDDLGRSRKELRRRTTSKIIMTDPAAAYGSICEDIATVLVGNEELVERLTVALLTRGHVLLEGVPSVAKTTATDLFATETGLDSRRIQMTPDSLPVDITGTHVYGESMGESVLLRGPIFSNFVVPEEILTQTADNVSPSSEHAAEAVVTPD